MRPLPGIEVAVQVNGVDAKEYDAPDCSSENTSHVTITKYIECVEDALFRLRVNVDKDYEWGYRNHKLCFEVLIDGQTMKGHVLGRSTEDIFDGVPGYDRTDGQWKLQKFRFSTIKLVDDDRDERAKMQAKHAKDLGVIVVRVMRGFAEKSHSATPVPCKGRDLEFTEKALKGQAVSHGTNLTLKVPTQRPRLMDFEVLPEDKGPLATLRFLYRSHEALKRELVIPRSPTPSFEKLSEAERNRLAMERFEQIKAAKDGIVKSEIGRDAKRTKTADLDEVIDLTASHAAGKSERAVKRVKPEVIDLTDD